MPTTSHIDRLLRHVQRHGVVRARDLETLGLPRVALQRAVDRDQVIRWARGVYVTPDHATTRHTDVAAVATRSPKAIICLVSALEYHGLSTQVPYAVWIMIQKSAHRPTFKAPAVPAVRAPGPALSSGVETHKNDGVIVHTTTPAKTVADCFRCRDAVGTDVAVEAMRDCLRKRKATPADNCEIVELDRVARVMQPYLEALARRRSPSPQSVVSVRHPAPLAARLRYAYRAGIVIPWQGNAGARNRIYSLGLGQ